MNRLGSLTIHENLTLYEGLPPQGLSELRRAGSFNFSFTDPPHREPLQGRRQSSCLRERVAEIPVLYLNTMIFLGNAL